MKPLTNYLESCDDLGAGNFHALLNCSLPGPQLDEANSRKLQFGVLKYIARFGLNTTYPAYWEVIHQELDTSFQLHFEACIG